MQIQPGSTMDVPLTVTFADYGGRSFVKNPVTFSGSSVSPGYALAAYIPTTPGLRTITVMPSGGWGIVHYPTQYGLIGNLAFFAIG